MKNSRRRLLPLLLAATCLGAAVLVVVLVSHDGTSTAGIAGQSTATTQHPHRSAKATTHARNQRLHRPPISTNYGQKTPCGEVRFKAPPYNATQIRVAGGASCEEAVALVRRTHEHCTYGVCDTAGYSCNGDDVATQVLSVDCRNRENEVTWYSGGGG